MQLSPEVFSQVAREQQFQVSQRPASSSLPVQLKRDSLHQSRFRYWNGSMIDTHMNFPVGSFYVIITGRIRPLSSLRRSSFMITV